MEIPVVNISLNIGDIHTTLVNEFNELRENAFMFPPVLRRERAIIVDPENCLFKIPRCHRFLPPRFQAILEEIVGKLLGQPSRVSRDQLEECNHIYDWKYNYGSQIFRGDYVPSFIEHVLSIIFDQESAIVGRCAKAHIVAQICMHEPEECMEFKLGTSHVWRKMLHEIPCPLLWHIYVVHGGAEGEQEILPENLSGFSELQRVFLLTTRY